ncbi:MAG: M12 family metallo-peptidase [Phycisphaerae bacterium]
MAYRLLILVAAIACGLSAQSVFAQRAAGLRAPPLSGSTAAALDSMLADYAIEILPPTPRSGGAFSTSVPINNQSYSLDLRPHSLRADGFRLRVAGPTGLTEVVPPAPTTYRGTVLDTKGLEIPGSRAAASLIDGQLSAVIDLQDGRLWYVQPLSTLLPNATAQAHVVFPSNAVIEPRHVTCGVTAIEPPGAMPTDPAPRGTGLQVAEIAIDADFLLYRDFNGSSVTATVADVENVMNGVDLVYQRDVGVTYEITTIVVRTTQVYTSTTADALLSEFINRWNTAPESAIVRDVAHLMTGINLSGLTIGLAAIPGVCAATPYGLSQTQFSSNLNSRIALTAHELGHNWGAFHCSGAGCNIMCPAIGGCGGVGLPNFSPATISAISNYKIAILFCLDPLATPAPLPFIEPFASTTLDTTRWSYNSGGLITTNGIGEPSAPNALNLDAVGPGEFQDDEIRSNFILLAGAGPVDIQYQTQHRGVPAGGQLVVEYWSANQTWVTLNTITSDGANQIAFVPHLHTLTAPDALHDQFRLRFRTLVDQSIHDWYIDDVRVIPTGADFDPPTPAPTIVTPLVETAASVEMTSTLAADAASPPVEYFFQAGGQPGSTDSGWQPGSTFIDVGLAPDTTYSYRVKARDSATPPNETSLSTSLTGRTLAAIPAAPLLINPTQTTLDLDVAPNGNPAVTRMATQCIATSPFDPAWEGRFVDTTGNPATLAVWRTDAEWGVTTVQGLLPGTIYALAVKARNQIGIETVLGPTASTTTTPTGAVGGDCDGNGAFELGLDSACFVDALLSMDTTPPGGIARSDMNADGRTDGLDIADFIACALNGCP